MPLVWTHLSLPAAHGQVTDNRKGCIAAGNVADAFKGMVHARYSCDDTGLGGTFWLLTYAFSDRGMLNDPDKIGVVIGCDNNCQSSSGTKNIQYTRINDTAGECAVECALKPPTCSATPSPGTCNPVCCDDLWPVMDYVPNGSNTLKWVGWIAKAWFGLPSHTGVLATYDTMMVHWDWAKGQESQDSGGFGTAASSLKNFVPGFCLTCPGEQVLLASSTAAVRVLVHCEVWA